MSFENPILTIEKAIIDRLQKAVNSGVLGYKIPVIASYSGEGDDDIPHLLKTRSPAVWVAYSGEDATDNSKDVNAYFSLIVYVRNNKSENAAREGSLNHAGAYQLINDIKKLLIKQDLGLPIEPFTFIEAKPIINARLEKYYTTMFGLRFKTLYTQPASGKPYSKLDDFLRVKGKWTIGQAQHEVSFNVNEGEGASCFRGLYSRNLPENGGLEKEAAGNIEYIDKTDDKEAAGIPADPKGKV